MMQHSLALCKYLHLVAVGADNIRPRAINNRPYEFYCSYFVFCGIPFL